MGEAAYRARANSSGLKWCLPSELGFGLKVAKPNQLQLYRDTGKDENTETTAAGVRCKWTR
jgi:hypothetical protein